MKIHSSVLLIAGLAGCAGVGPADVAEEGGADALAADALVCSKLTLTSGSIGSGQSARALATKDQSGTQDSWAKYVEFSKGASATCAFSVGSGAAAVTALSLEVNYRGPMKAEMLWVFEALDVAAGTWVFVADNGFASEWNWSAATTAFPGGASRFIDANGQIQVRFSTTSKADVSQLDEWILHATRGSSDAGVPVADAGGTVDAGGSKDAGSGTDAGSKADAGSGKDAGGGADAGPVCVPACSGKQCGSDGCGGTCGACGSGQSCSAAGQCATSSGWWKPTNDVPLHFHWQLSDTFSYPSDVVAGETVYDIDGDNNTAATVAALHAAGYKVICYMEVGSVENYRSDYQDFVNAGVVGKGVQGWAGEYWLDIRQTDKILPLLKTRMTNWCLNKGFDAIEPDDSDVWDNASGFSITQAQNDAFNEQVAALAHSLGLSIGLKNNPDSAVTLAPYYDWALVEECWNYNECTPFQQSFLAQDKPVWEVEYSKTPNCSQASSWHMTSMKRDLDLHGPHASGYLYQPCIPDSQTTW